MAERICFLGRGGSGKSTIAQNLSAALAQKGYHVLLVGNDIALSSTMLLRKEADIVPALEVYREKYEIDLIDYILATDSGVWCLELGSIDPGIGCLARGVSLIDEMLDYQGVSNTLQLDFVIYDTSGETPCTGYILPIREGLMQRCVLVSNGSFASVTAVNTILQAIERTGANIPVQLFVNNADCRETRKELAAYAKQVSAEVLAYFDYDKKLEYSTLAGRTIFDAFADSDAANQFLHIADKLLSTAANTKPTPFPRKDLLVWLGEWQKRELARRMALEVSADV